MQLNTAFLLMAEFNTGVIPLETVASRFLNMEKKKAYYLANKEDLPFNTFRLGSSKGGRYVSVNDLAAYIDSQREKGLEEWEKFNKAS